MARVLRIGLRDGSLRRGGLRPGLGGGSLFTIASLDLRFAEQKTLDSRITFTRASSGTFVDSAGVIQTATTNVPRFDHNPTTGESLGLLVEEARTNSIRNNTMVGAVAGTPGTLPTNWSVATSATGLSSQIIGTGTESGIAYIDIKWTGTPSTSGAIQHLFEANTNTAAISGQNWTASVYQRLVGGTIPGSTSLLVVERSAANVFLTSSSTSTTTTDSALINQRFIHSRTLNNASTAYVNARLDVNVASGVAIDFTLRIGLPQLEQGTFATSVIPTTTATVTRSADVASITGTAFSSWYRQDEGTVFADVAVAQPSTGGNQFVFRTSDNGYSNAIAINIPGQAQLSTASGGTFDGSASSVASLVANVSAKIGAAYTSNNLGLSLNGATAVIDTSATIPTALNRADIGSDHAGVNRVKAGTIRRLTYWPTRLANNTLQEVTR